MTIVRYYNHKTGRTPDNCNYAGLRVFVKRNGAVDYVGCYPLKELSISRKSQPEIFLERAKKSELGNWEAIKNKILDS